MIARFKKNSYRWSPLAVILIIAISCVSLSDAIESKKPSVSWSRSEPSVSLRRVKTGPMSDFSSPPSPDGRYLCDLGSRDAEGNTCLAIRDLVTGEVRPLTEASRAFPMSPVISPESKHVAYVCQSWFPPKSELQIIRMDGTGTEFSIALSKMRGSIYVLGRRTARKSSALLRKAKKIFNWPCSPSKTVPWR